MYRDLIIKTALCYWSDEDEDLLVSSPFCPEVIGTGETEERAWEIFHLLLNQRYIAHLEGRLTTDVRRRGRPAKELVSLGVTVKPEVKAQITKLSEELGCSQGEAIEWLLFYREKSVVRKRGCLQ